MAVAVHDQAGGDQAGDRQQPSDTERGRRLQRRVADLDQIGHGLHVDHVQRDGREQEHAEQKQE